MCQHLKVPLISTFQQLLKIQSRFDFKNIYFNLSFQQAFIMNLTIFMNFQVISSPEGFVTLLASLGEAVYGVLKIGTV